MRALPQAERWPMFGLWATAAFLASISLFVFWREPISLNQLTSALLFSVMMIIADLNTQFDHEGRSFSVAGAVLIAGITSLNWPLLLMSVVIATAGISLSRGLSWHQVLATTAMRLLACVAGGVVVLPRWGTDPFSIPAIPYTTLGDQIALLAVGLIFFLVERGSWRMIDVARTGDTTRLGRMFTSLISDLPSYVFLLAPLGGLLAIVWQISGLAFLLGIVPLIILQRTIASRTELSRRNRDVQTLARDRAAISHQLERLQEISIALIAIRDVQTMLQTLCVRLAALMDASHGWVVLFDEVGPPRMVAWHNLPEPPEGAGPHEVPWPKQYFSAVERRTVTLFTDQRLQMLAPTAKLSLGSYWKGLIFIPLIEEQRVLGAICLSFSENRTLRESEQRILTAFARQAALVIENARLFRKLQESQVELVQSSKLAAVGTFAAGIAHEFNNLLGGMLGYAQLGLGTDNSHEKDEALQVVVNTCKRGKSITGSLLTFARRREPRRELAALYDTVNDTLTLMELQLRAHHITVQRQIEPVPLTICDPGQISQVFLNLLTNARDAMIPDGGTLTVRLTHSERTILISVSDTGSGIPSHFRNKIFEPFVTSKGALGGSSTPGTGLGLSISYGIIKGHGGSIEVDSAIGKGTTMTIKLPIYEDPAIAAFFQHDIEAPIDLPALRLLLVDDDQAVALSLRALLERAGHKVTCVYNAMHALEAYQREPFDIVMTDLHMPGMGGVELISAIKALDPNMLAIAFTGQVLDSQIAAAQAVGASRVLSKPFEMTEVLGALSAVWSERHATVKA